MITIQEALKQLYYSLGGNADNVRDTDSVNEIILKTATPAKSLLASVKQIWGKRNSFPT